MTRALKQRCSRILLVAVSTLAAVLLPNTGCQRETRVLLPAPALTPQPSRPSEIKVIVHDGGPLVLQTGAAEFQVLPSGYIEGLLPQSERKLSIDEPRVGSPTSSDYLLSRGKEIHFTLDFSRVRILELQGEMGRGKRVEIPGRVLGPSAGSGIQQMLAIEAFDDFPNVIFTTAEYHNDSQSEFPVDQAIMQWHRLNARLIDSKAQPYELWSFRGSTYSPTKDDVVKIARGFAQPRRDEVPANFGGDIPLVAFWTRAVGVAIGHIGALPISAYVQTRVAGDGRVVSCLMIPAHVRLQPGQSYSTPRSLLAAYSGDYYEPLRIWASVLAKEGATIPKLVQFPRQEQQKKWAAVYNQVEGEALAKGAFRNLYLEGYDLPTGYAIERNGKLYYTFFTAAPSKPWKGEVELRGLAPGNYLVRDYEQGKELGTIEVGADRTARVHTDFRDELILEVTRL